MINAVAETYDSVTYQFLIPGVVECYWTVHASGMVVHHGCY